MLSGEYAALSDLKVRVDGDASQRNKPQRIVDMFEKDPAKWVWPVACGKCGCTTCRCSDKS